MVNLKLVRVAAALLLSSLAIEGSAQNITSSVTMNLDECLEYAKEKSITLQMAQLGVDDSEWEQLISKGAFLPVVSGSVSQSLGSNPFSETSSLKGIYSGSYGVDLSMTLYSGGSNRAQLQKSLIDGDIASLEVDELSSSLEMAITELYVEILYAVEQIEVAKGNLELSVRNQERGEAFLEQGSINKADYAQLESATASSRYDIVEAETQLSSLYVALRHLLEIPYDVAFAIDQTPLSDEALMAPIPLVVDVYQVALDSRPEIESSKLYIETAELDYTIAKAGYLPTLSLSAGAGVNHNSFSTFDFSSQLRENFALSAGLNLSIPIFSAYKNKSSVAIAQNSIKRASLSLSEAEKELYQTIETLRNNASNAQAMYAVSEYLLASNLTSLELTTEQYEVGLKSIIELLTEQDNYNQTQQEYLMNKYKLILNKALLNYYKTNIINL